MRKITYPQPGARPAYGLTGDAKRVLDFDIEVRPLSWYGGDWVTKEPTAIAWAWIEDGKATNGEVHMLSHRKGSGKRMLSAFREAYDEADMVCGHYIRGFDLPTLQWGYAEYRLPLLTEKLTHDTKGDLIKMQGLSKSQENLASALGIASPKVGMSMNDWRQANRLTPIGLELVEERVVADVVQNIEMRAELIRLGWLGAPRLWTPDGSGTTPSYTP